jgi:hypothetical protein
MSADRVRILLLLNLGQMVQLADLLDIEIGRCFTLMEADAALGGNQRSPNRQQPTDGGPVYLREACAKIQWLA